MKEEIEYTIDDGIQIPDYIIEMSHEERIEAIQYLEKQWKKHRKQCEEMTGGERWREMKRLEEEDSQKLERWICEKRKRERLKPVADNRPFYQLSTT